MLLLLCGLGLRIIYVLLSVGGYYIAILKHVSAIKIKKSMICKFEVTEKIMVLRMKVGFSR